MTNKSRGMTPPERLGTIRLDANNKPEVTGPDGTKNSIRVGCEGRIKWTSDHPGILWWAVMMKGASPFVGGTGVIGAAGGEEGGATIRPDANGGGTGTRTYRYSVYAFDGSTVHETDPEIVVGPRDDDDDGGG